MKVLLKEDVDNIGYAGEVHKVADGYGRNYLIPKGLAVLASPSVMKQAEVWRKKAEARRAELRAEYQALSARIEDLTLNYTARAGDRGKLYGSITTTQIADDLNELLGTEIDRRKVGSEPLRQLGKHKVVVRLSADFQPHVTVVIESEDGAGFVEEVEVVEEIDEVETLDETLEDTEAIVDDIEEELEEDEEDYWDEFDSDELG